MHFYRYIVPSPIRDEHGRRVILYFSSMCNEAHVNYFVNLFYFLDNFDPYKYSSEDMARIHMLTYETLINDEINQILGFTHIAEAKGVSMAHITLWSPTEFATIMKWGEVSTQNNVPNFKLVIFVLFFSNRCQ